MQESRKELVLSFRFSEWGNNGRDRIYAYDLYRIGMSEGKKKFHPFGALVKRTEKPVGRYVFTSDWPITTIEKTVSDTEVHEIQACLREDHFTELCAEIERETVHEYADRCVLLAMPSFSFFLSSEMGVKPVRVSIETELDHCPLFEDRETLMRIRAAGERIAEIFDRALP